MKRLTIAVMGLALAVLASACGGEKQEDESALARTYVAEICEPFAKYVESYTQVMALETEGITSPDDLLEMGRRMKANAQARLAEFRSVEPPAAIRNVHEQLLTGLQTEIDELERLETALQNYMRTGNKGELDRALAAVDEALSSAGVGPYGMEFENVPEPYLEAWERDCVPRLEQIPGVGD